ncbi:putative Cellulose synthase (UDP-forming) [Vibrio nigripulchritudo SO65]|uniref:UDP-forming cellulose synthase catalytic subunit n=1 Tax=Vibrio nigripulchritudo TaxID=28173 RepID=UPI0003B20EEB|nr:UDP-forming cellulose synthase catalytic subunit [Vibrio nigripulchritudo]CCN36599.1 putative Cellulose synthase (UDP-forming) [Vibrio nigripulchritudo AM115]CCN40454.1 putative Cellulose synthase (UDP-forming) [Vibrio nigripulchritudo FTn2]CCN79061.1 putative Cellulose synthase (UDP-forming) [Vibrio nigripulchritudo SO65]
MNPGFTKQLFKGLLLLCALYALYVLATLNISTETHLWLAASSFVLIVLLSRNLSTRATTFILFIGAFISFRYIYWRFQETLPWESGLDLPFAMLLFAAECYGILVYIMGMFVTVKPYERKRVPINEDEHLPTVDVYIPTYNEPMDVVGPTILAASRLDYLGEFRVFVLDDGGTQQKFNDQNADAAEEARSRAAALKTFCEEVGASYITREKNQQAKAGNINHALGKTSGELILILDADHVPTKDFLMNTIGLFQQDSKLGFVQTPHFFVTPGPVERNLGIEDKVPSENEMFYNKTLVGMDFWNGCFFCGSAAVIRRAALEEVGGISTKTITEDADTALNIHSNGWSSAYLNMAMVAGLSPDTFGAYVTQRSRWAQGMIQIFLLNNPLFKKGLSLPQRICYLNSTLYWFFPIFRTVFLISPLLYLLLDLQIFVGNTKDFLIYVIPHLVISVMITQRLFGKTRRAFFSELYETALSIYLCLPTLSVLIKPKKPSFVVTPKGETTQTVSFSKLTPFMASLCGLVVLAEIWGIYRYIQFPAEQSQLMLVIMFNTFNLLLIVLCLGAMLERQQRRSEPRLLVNEKAVIKQGEQTIHATLNDISLKGAKLTLRGAGHDVQRGDIINVGYFSESGRYSKSKKPHYKFVNLNMRVVSVKNGPQGHQISCLLASQLAEDMQVQYAKAYGQSSRWKQRRQYEESLKRGVIASVVGLFSLACHHLTRVLTTSVKQKVKTSDYQGRKELQSE